MKNTVRILLVALLAVLLCAVMLLSLASCAKNSEEVPDGMQIASCAGADYRLYVPTSWVVNNSYGVSGAYRNIKEQSTVSVVSYPVSNYSAHMAENGVNVEDSGERIAWFWNDQCRTAVARQDLNGEIALVEEECVSTSLGGANAKQYRYSALIDGQRLHFLQVVAEREGRFYVFTMSANEKMLESCLADAGKMLEVFVFADPYEPENKKIIEDGEAPEGMKLASGEDVAYCFYVPKSWEIRYDESIYAAHDPTDMTSVSVTPYRPDAVTMRVSEYFEMSRQMMENMAGTDGFTLISDSEKVNLGGREATVYEFRLRVGGVEYHYRQYIAAYKSMIYCLTYTATEDHFDAHLEELSAIVSAFQFR